MDSTRSREVEGEPDSKEKDEILIMKSEDESFIEFAKSRIALLATVAAVPIISSGINALNPPTQKFDLSILSSIICLIVFSGTYLLKDSLSNLVLKEEGIRKLIPFFLALLVCLCGISLTAKYVQMTDSSISIATLSKVHEGVVQVSNESIIDTLDNKAHIKSEPFLDRWIDTKSLVYLLIFPSFMLALGIVLVTLWVVNEKSYHIQALVRAKLQSEAPEIQSHLKALAKFRSSGFKNSVFYELGNELLRDHRETVKNLGEGRIEVFGMDTPRLQGLLMSSYKQSFHAVSDRDLSFWLMEENEQMGKEYFKANVQAVKNGTAVTRLFIIKAKNLRFRLDDIKKVLIKQQQAGIGWAVAIYEELNYQNRGSRGLSLDFALFGWKDPERAKAVTFFREYRDRVRSFRAVFNIDGNKKNIDVIDGQTTLYKGLLTECWLVNQKFKIHCKDLIIEIRTKLKDNNNSIIARLNSVKEIELKKDQDFLIEVVEETEIEDSLKLMNDISLVNWRWYKG